MGGAASVMGGNRGVPYQYAAGGIGSVDEDSSALSPPSWIGSKLEIPPKPFRLENHFNVHAIIGTGMLGKVRLIEHKKTRKFYALKTMAKQSIMDAKMLDQVLEEKKALSKMQHPFLVRCFGTLQTANNVHLILEYVPGGELFRRLHQVKRFCNDEAKFYATELVVFLESIHARGYMYRDLKPENVLLDAQGHVKVVDLGFIKPFSDEASERTSTCVGTPQYLAPEQLTQSTSARCYTRIVDWWALACVIYEMVNGEPPFFHSKGDSSFELYTRILQGHIHWPYRMHAALKDLLKHMLQSDISKRLCHVDRIKEHRWFSDVDWHEVAQRHVHAPFRPNLETAGDHTQFDEYPETADSHSTCQNGVMFAREFRSF